MRRGTLGPSITRFNRQLEKAKEAEFQRLQAQQHEEIKLERAKAQHSSRKGFALAAMALLNKGHRTARLSLREEEE